MNNSGSDLYGNFTGALQKKKKACKIYVLFRKSIHFLPQRLLRSAGMFEVPVGVLP